ncbi:MAG: hypothetical protein ACRC6M_04135 [Microcystaceae cyanobacterium]
MTVEKLETPQASVENEAKETAKTTATRTRKAKEEQEITALSLPNQTGGLKFLTHPSGLPSNRPVEASHLNVVSTYKSVGSSRPVTASGIEVSSTLTISGNRPIQVSHLKISETYSVMGNRPVASNEIDDPGLLMGYLD